MRRKYLAIPVASIVGIYMPAKAATITQYVVGTISGGSTVDYEGAFAPAGTDLTGKNIHIYFQYATEDFKDFGCGAPPGSSCDIRFSKSLEPHGDLANVATPQSILISIRIDGIGRSFAPFKQGSVYVFNTPGSPGQIEVSSDNPVAEAPAAKVELYYASTTAFGARLSPNNNPVNVSYPGAGNENSVQVSEPMLKGKYAGETLTFTITGYGK